MSEVGPGVGWGIHVSEVGECRREQATADVCGVWVLVGGTMSVEVGPGVWLDTWSEIPPRLNRSLADDNIADARATANTAPQSPHPCCQSSSSSSLSLPPVSVINIIVAAAATTTATAAAAATTVTRHPSAFSLSSIPIGATARPLAISYSAEPLQASSSRSISSGISAIITKMQ